MRKDLDFDIRDKLKEESNKLFTQFCLENQDFINNSIELGLVTNLLTGWQISRTELEKRANDNGNAYLLQIANITNYEMRDLKRYQVEDDYINKFRLFKNDIIITAKSPKVEMLVVDNDDNIYIPAGTLTVLRLNENIDPYFIVSFLESNKGKELIKIFQTGNVIKNLTPNNIKKIPIPKMDYKKQIKIGKEFKDTIELIINHNQQVERLKKEILKNKYFI